MSRILGYMAGELATKVSVEKFGINIVSKYMVAVSTMYIPARGWAGHKKVRQTRGLEGKPRGR